MNTESPIVVLGQEILVSRKLVRVRVFNRFEPGSLAVKSQTDFLN